MKPISIKYGNCLLWVLIQRIFLGGKIKIAKRELWWKYYWPHFYWFDGNRSWQYSPRARVGDGKGIDTPIFFEGVIQRIVKI